MKKIYVFINSGAGTRFVCPSAICEDGKVLAGHCCSHEGFVALDMGFNSNRKHNHYNEHCGKGGWELEFVKAEDIDKHKELQLAFERNKALAEPVNEEAMPCVKVEIQE
jgi:hypothetical protein